VEGEIDFAVLACKVDGIPGLRLDRSDQLIVLSPFVDLSPFFAVMTAARNDF